MYVCLVDGCPETFQHDDKRTRHLIKVHQYPESFSFHQWRKQKKNGKADKENTNAQYSTNQPKVDDETLKKREARKRRRQQKKKKLMEKAKREDSGMQVDAGAVAQHFNNSSDSQSERNENTGVDMMELEESMRELRIPKAIQFGRKRRV
ncbi:unnamed protein product [Phytophthora fragariaefolia]|uniref:Unnamed protein product n=1 Tax=Phytophthora fragariaefolia TaxID=1490495 RepID=A0A9W7D381_9STRA|nr:unnamed protein product [Phytophthora fragariaefolia]